MAYYRVYVASDANPTAFTMLATTTSTEVLLADLGLTAGQNYYTFVTAVSATEVESDPSMTISFKY